MVYVRDQKHELTPPRNRKYPCDNGYKEVTVLPSRDIVYDQAKLLFGLRHKPITQQDALPRSEFPSRFLPRQDPLSLFEASPLINLIVQKGVVRGAIHQILLVYVNHELTNSGSSRTPKLYDRIVKLRNEHLLHPNNQKSKVRKLLPEASKNRKSQFPETRKSAQRRGRVGRLGFYSNVVLIARSNIRIGTNLGVVTLV
ncbi:hypothetical protein GQ457_14G021000 [Hibiscus cannabinus]